jgi:acyl dehydratase
MVSYLSIDDLARHVGKSLGTTGWQTIDQARIDAFAAVTGDQQWIHVDPQRARTQSPFGRTVAHGALTLSLCSTFLTELLQVKGVRLVVNAGVDKVRFQTPVPVGSRLQGSAMLREVRTIPGGARVVVRIRVVLAGATRPACTADQILAFYT